MKRDAKLEKLILTALRDTNAPEDIWLDMTVKNYHPEIIHEHFKLLCEKGLIDAIDCSTFSGIKYIPQRLTSLGHSYLEEISKTCWHKFKREVLKASGKFMWMLAGALVTAAVAVLVKNIFGICR